MADLADAILAETLAEMRIRLALVGEWMAGEDRLERNAPAGGVVGFVRMRRRARVAIDATRTVIATGITTRIDEE